MNRSTERETEQHRPYFTMEEIISLQGYSGLDMSADGAKVAFVERIADWDENRYVDRVWTYHRDERTCVLVTPDATGGNRPKWSPDGTELAYTRMVGNDGNQQLQLFVKSPNQAEGIQVTQLRSGIGSYAFAPDGAGIYFLAPRDDKALKRRKDTYGDFEYIDVDYQRQTLYYVDLAAAISSSESRYELPKDLRKVKDGDVAGEGTGVADAHGGDDRGTMAGGGLPKAGDDVQQGDGDDARAHDTASLDRHVSACFGLPDWHVQGFDISPDGRKIVFSAAPSPNFEDITETALFLFDTQTKVVTKIELPFLNVSGGTEGAATDATVAAEDAIGTTADATGTAADAAADEKISLEGRINGQARFAPDSERFAFSYQTGDAKMFRNNAIAVFNATTGELVAIPQTIDEDLSLVAWTDAGLVMEWQNRTNRWIERIDEAGNRTPVVTGDGVMAFGCSVSQDGRSVAYIQATVDAPTDVYVDGEPITGLRETFAKHRVSKRRVVQWESRDGSEIEGVLCVPDDFDESKRYPLLLVVHGGPTWASFPSPTQDKYYPIEQFVERGFIVLLPNYRGSSGYGQAFRSLNERNLGVGDYWDVISGVEFLVGKGYADADKVGVMGWSQGGYISAFCTTYSQEFKAVSVGAGISNWVTYYVNTDIHPFTRDYLGATPWDDMEVYQKTSPMTYIKGAVTPTLIQHGDKDSRVPLPNAFELYQGLRDVGTEAQLVVFKGMQHGSDKPGWNRAIMHQNYAWFCHHVLGDPLDDFWL